MRLAHLDAACPAPLSSAMLGGISTNTHECRLRRAPAGTRCRARVPARPPATTSATTAIRADRRVARARGRASADSVRRSRLDPARLLAARACSAGTDRAERGHQREREHQRADERERIRERERTEDAALDRLQREHRHQRGDDDAASRRASAAPTSTAERTMSCEQRLAPYRGRSCCIACMTFSTSTTAPSTRMPKSIAPIEIRFAGSPIDVQADERDEQRERDHRPRRSREPTSCGGTARRPPTTSKKPCSRLSCTVASVWLTRSRAVVEGLDLHALRQYRVVQLVDLAGARRRARATDSRRGASATNPSTISRSVVPADRAAPRRAATARLGDVADRDRRAVAGLERHAASDVLGRVDVADAAHRELLVAMTQEAAADVDVRLARARRSRSRERHAVRAEAIGIDLDVDLLQVAAEAAPRRPRPAPGAARA